MLSAGDAKPPRASWLQNFEQKTGNTKKNRSIPKNNQFCVAMYKQLHSQKRLQILALLQKNVEKKDIALIAGHSGSTVYKERASVFHRQGALFVEQGP